MASDVKGAMIPSLFADNFLTQVDLFSRELRSSKIAAGWPP